MSSQPPNTPGQPAVTNEPPPPSIPRVYFNGFQSVITPGDTSIVLQLDNEPLVVLRCSHVLAKTLATKLFDIVKALEAVSRRDVMTTDELNAAFERFNNEQQGTHNPGGQQ